MNCLCSLPTDLVESFSQGKVEFLTKRVQNSPDSLEELEITFLATFKGKKWVAIATRHQCINVQETSEPAVEENDSFTPIRNPYLVDSSSWKTFSISPLSSSSELHSSVEESMDSFTLLHKVKEILDSDSPSSVSLRMLAQHFALKNFTISDALKILRIGGRATGEAEFQEHLYFFDRFGPDDKLRLRAEGFLLVDLEQYESFAEKRTVASKALPPLLALDNKDIPADLNDFIEKRIRLLAPYADRDVLLSSSGGIMSGLGLSQGRKRWRSDNTEVKSFPCKAKPSVAKVELVSIDQCPFSWEQCDLSQYFRGEQAEYLRELDKNRPKSTRNAFFFFDESSDSQVLASLENYSKLLQLFGDIQLILFRYSKFTLIANAWRENYAVDARCSSKLVEELNKKWEDQVGPRFFLEKKYSQCHAELYAKERDLVNYIFFKNALY